MKAVTAKKHKSVSKRPKKKPITALERKKMKALKLLDELKGLAPNLWNEDAQEYVNRLRGNDRF
jgi:hypothetical protein